MRINFISILLTVFYTAFNISPASSVWIMIPLNGVKCGADVLLTKYNLADAVEPGCNRMARSGHNWWFKLVNKPILPKPYQGPHFTSSLPRFELNIKIKRLHSHGIFQFPKHKVIFEWNEKLKICIPRGVIKFIKPGSQHRCDEFYNPLQKNDDSFGERSFGRYSNAQKDYELQKFKSDYSPESTFEIGDFPQSHGFSRSAQSYKEERFQEDYLSSSPLESSRLSATSSRKSEHLSSQMSPMNLPMSSPPHRQKLALQPQRSSTTIKPRLGLQKSSPPSGHESASQLQRSHSTLSSKASGYRKAKDFKFRSKSNPNLSPQASSEMSQAPQKSESIRSDQRLHNSSENRERPQPKVNTPVNEKSVISRINIENSQDLGLISLVKSP